MMAEMMDSPMHAQLYNSLKDWFTDGFSLSDRLPTEQEIMQRFSVGRGTARAALNELARDGIVIRTPGRGSFLAPDYMVRLKRYAVAILLSEREFSGSDSWEYSWHNHLEMLNGVMKEALMKNISLEIIPEGAIGAELNGLYDAFISFRYIREEKLSLLHRPVIPFHYELDMAGGLAGIVRHLVGCGYGSPAYIGTARAGRISLINSFLMMSGQEPLPGAMVIECSGTSRDGYEACAALLEKETRPDCIICSTDMRALGVLSCLKDRGIGIPDELGVYGFDGMRESESSSPGLTTWAFPWQELGVRAVHELRSLLDGVDISPYEPLKGSLCVRESTKERPAEDSLIASRRAPAGDRGDGAFLRKRGEDRRIVALPSWGLDFYLSIGETDPAGAVDPGDGTARMEWKTLLGRCLQASERSGGATAFAELLVPPGGGVFAAASEAQFWDGAELPVWKARSGAVVWEGTVTVEVLDYPLPALRLSGPEPQSLLRNAMSLLEAGRELAQGHRPGKEKTEGPVRAGIFFAGEGGLIKACLVFYRPAEDGEGGARSGGEAAKRAAAAAGALSRTSPPVDGEDLSRWIEARFRRCRPGGVFGNKTTEELLSLLRRA